MSTLAPQITIDPEFKALIPQLTDEERAQLEQNLVADGCREPLVIWDDILIDGHNRLEICMRRGIRYQTEVKNFESRDAAKIWIIRNQFGRRNIQPYVRAELALKLEPLIAAKAKENQRAGGAVGGQSPAKGLQNSVKASEKVNTQANLATVAGVSHDTIARAKVIAERAPEPVKQALRKGETSINKVYTDIKRQEREERRDERRHENAKKIELITKPADIAAVGARFATIVIDPPWDWGDEGDVNQMGRAKPDYSTMGLDELMELPVSRLADDDCHIYLWITNRSLPKGFKLLDRWGFRYVTALTWVKESFGMGNYFRGSTEHVLFGVKGSQMLRRKDVGTHFSAKRPGGHSAKPEEFYKLVETCSPGPYLEMFARRERSGWKTWGENS